MTRILTCTCAHDYQDARYGRRNRVHNICPPDQRSAQPTWRCTVCGKERG